MPLLPAVKQCQHTLTAEPAPSTLYADLLLNLHATSIVLRSNALVL